MFIHNNLFSLVCKSDGISFNQSRYDELEPNFKVVDNVISDKRFKSFIEYEYKPKKVQSPITNKLVYNSDTFNQIKAVPFCSCM